MSRPFVRGAIGGFVLLLLVGLGVLSYPWLSAPPAGAALSIGGPFSLTAGDGRTVTEADFRGRWMLIYFGYTHCPDACPTALSDMEAALDKLGPKKAEIVPIFITVDPERDTPAAMKDYVASFGSDIIGLSGSPAAIAATEKEYRVYAAKHPTKDGNYDMDHSSIIYVMGPDGKFVTNFSDETGIDGMAKSLDRLVS
jgi:protein SCO1/2